MKLLGSTKSKITKKWKWWQYALFRNCNVVNNSYQLISLYTFGPNKCFGQLLYISPKNFIYLKTFASEFSYIDVWFNDKNSESLDIEDKIKITLVID